MRFKFKDLEIDTKNNFLSTLIIIVVAILCAFAVKTAGDFAEKYFDCDHEVGVGVED